MTIFIFMTKVPAGLWQSAAECCKVTKQPSPEISSKAVRNIQIVRLSR
jgi:hypothetical protein